MIFGYTYTKLLALASISLIGIVALYYYPPSEYQYIPCMINLATGLHCPGCGTTRAVASLLKGNIQEALQNNILLFIWGPYIMYIGLIKIRAELKGIEYKPWQPNKLIIFLLISIVIAFTIVRNLPIESCTVLFAPH